jgi:amidase
MARTAEDTAALLSVIAGFDPLDPTSLCGPVPDYRAELARPARTAGGFDEAYCGEGLPAALARVLRQTCQRLDAEGAQIQPVRIPSGREFSDRWVRPGAVEASLAHEPCSASVATRTAGRSRSCSTRDCAAAGSITRAPARQASASRGRSPSCSRAWTCSSRRADPGPWTSLTLGELAALPTHEAARMIAYTAPYNGSSSPSLSLPAVWTTALHRSGSSWWRGPSASPSLCGQGTRSSRSRAGIAPRHPGPAGSEPGARLRKD